MKTLIVATAFAAALALSGVSQAAQISTPTIFGTGEQDKAHCIVLNGGTSPLAVTVKLLNEYGGTEATYSCSGPLGAGQFCALRRSIDNAGAYACIATAGSTTKLRGALILEEELLDPVWGTTFLRPVRPRRCSRRCPAGDVTVPAVLAHGRRGYPSAPVSRARGGEGSRMAVEAASIIIETSSPAYP